MFDVLNENESDEMNTENKEEDVEAATYLWRQGIEEKKFTLMNNVNIFALNIHAQIDHFVSITIVPNIYRIFRHGRFLPSCDFFYVFLLVLSFLFLG